MKLIDAFIFNNEINLLRFRLTELEEVVDHFLIIEARQTFTGNIKPLYYKENQHLFERHASKIISVVIEEFPKTLGTWEREFYQRNRIFTGLANVPSLQSNDLVIFGDADEIPDAKTLMAIKETGLQGIHQLHQHLYYYTIENRCVSLDWRGQKIGNVESLGDNIHNHRISNYPDIPNGGWHFSYFGGFDNIVKKIQDFSHQEYNNESFLNQDMVKLVTQGKDLFRRHDVIFKHIPAQENPYLPSNYKMLL